MSSGDDKHRDARSKALVAVVAIGALLIWFAALWFMFGDVL